jgi:hypothetical protein
VSLLGRKLRLKLWLRRIPLLVTLVYAIFIGIGTLALFREPARTGSKPLPANSLTLDQQQRERAIRAETGAWKAFLLALPWILILNPSSGHLELYFAALLLNAATVFGIATWLIPPSHRRGK